MNSNRYFIKTAFALIFCALLMGCGVSEVPNLPQTSKPMPPVIGSNADLDPNKLAWNLVNGERKKIADYKGQVVVLDFWATYCPPCEEGIPYFVEMHQKHKADGLNIVGLHVGGTEDRPKVADFVRKYRMSYGLGYPDQALSDFLMQGDTSIPQTFVFNRQGELVQKFVGFSPQIKADLDKTIQEALTKQ
jgi:thiol-disulfide isomerase/thioredoxin